MIHSTGNLSLLNGRMKTSILWCVEGVGVQEKNLDIVEVKHGGVPYGAIVGVGR